MRYASIFFLKVKIYPNHRKIKENDVLLDTKLDTQFTVFNQFLFFIVIIRRKEAIFAIKDK